MKTIEKIYKNHYQRILTYLTIKVQDRSIAEDITSEVFIKAIKYLPTYDSTKSSETTWLINIANSCLVDFFRLKNNRDSKDAIKISDYIDKDNDNEYFVLADSYSTEKEVENNELHTKITDAIKSLKPKYRKIATLYFLKDRPYYEVATICDIPMGTVRATISRCRDKLQKLLIMEKREYCL